MRKATTILIAFALFIAACGGGGDAGGCEGVADDAIDLIQGLIDDVDNMSVEELSSMDELPGMAEFTSDFSDLETKANDLSCSDSEMQDLLLDRLDTLTAKSQFGELMLTTFKDEAASGF